MKKILLSALMVLLCFTVSAQQFGLSLNLEIDNYLKEDTGSELTDNSSVYGATAYYYLDESSEIALGVKYYSSVQEDPDDLDTEVSADYSLSELGIYAGFLKTMIEGKFVDIVLGPQIYSTFGIKPTGDSAPDDYSYMQLGLELPLFADLNLSEALALRMGTTIMDLHYTGYTASGPGWDIEWSTFYFDTLLFTGGANIAVVFKF